MDPCSRWCSGNQWTAIKNNKGIIANDIQQRLVMAKPIHDEAIIERLVIQHINGFRRRKRYHPRTRSPFKCTLQDKSEPENFTFFNFI